jgi:predicted nucleic acid-binding protein
MPAQAYKNDPHTRVLPDANVWLDAAFWPKGVAARAVAFLRTQSIPVILEEQIEDEAKKILRRRASELRLSFDPVIHFSSFTHDFLRVPPADLIPVWVNKSDAHIARAAIHYRALLLTQDTPLIAECLSEGILAQFPWSVLASLGDTLPEDEILRVMPPGAHSGTIFVRVTPGGWKGMKNVGQFTVCDLENIGHLFFDSGSNKWVFNGAQRAELDFPPAALGQSIVSVTYKLPSTGTGKIVLRAYSPASGERGSSTVNTLRKIKQSCGQVRVGSSLAGDAYWNGVIRHLTTSPEGLGAVKWKAFCEVPDAAPDPMNKGALSSALLAMDGRGH